MKLCLIIFLLTLVRGSCGETSHVLHGLFYDSDQTHVLYGSVDLDTLQFQIVNSLDVNEVGDPRRIKYTLLPMTYDPNNDVVYFSAPDDQNKTILSVINATTGVLLSTFQNIPNSIISLQYDIFQKQLFTHIEYDQDNTTQIVEIDTNTGTYKQILGTLQQIQPTAISSYCPICRKYFLMGQQNNQFVYIGVASTDGGGISWQSPINVSPISIKFDYKTFTMYTTYVNSTNQMHSLLGVLNRTLGGISEIVGTISNDSRLVVTSLSAFDIAENLFYASNLFNSPTSLGISYVNTNTSEVKSIPFPRSKYNPYGWFVKQFIH